jgi:hypothetical protein
MSYVLQVWQQPDVLPLPGDLDSAARLVDALQARAPDSPSRFIDLATRLRQRYPCICSPEADRLPRHLRAWTDGPLDGDADCAVYGLGLNTEMLGDVLPFVVRTALSLGLNVADEQAGRYYLSNQQVLSAGAAAPVNAPVRDKDALLDMLAARLDPVLAEQGFAPDAGASHWRSQVAVERQYRASFAGGSHTLRLTVAQQDGHFVWSLKAGSRFDRIGSAAAYFEYGSNQPEGALEGETMVLRQGAWLQDVPRDVELDVNRAYVVRRLADVERSGADMVAQMKRRLFSILALFRSARGVNILLNPQPVSSSFYFMAYHLCTPNVLAAYYARDPQLEALCEELLARTRSVKLTGDFAAAQLDKLRRCIAHVRNNPLRD